MKNMLHELKTVHTLHMLGLWWQQWS